MPRHTKLITISALLIFAIACGRQDARKAEANRPAVADFSAPLRISAQETDAAEPAVAAGSDGTIYIVWVEHRAKKEADVMLARLDQNGKALAEPVRVNPNAGQATAWRGDPPTIVTAPDGTVYVAWSARITEGHATNLYLSTSRDGGRTFEQPVKVNDDKEPAARGMHSMAVDKTGRVYVAWLDERNVKPDESEMKMEDHKMEANREVFIATSLDGGRTFLPNRVIAREACPCCKTAAAVGADGRVYVGWRQVLPGNYRHIAVASSTDGQIFSEPVVASDDRWVIMGCPVSGPALATRADGSLRVLWYSAGEAAAPGLYWSESRDGGKSFTPRVSLAEGSAFGTPLLIAAEGDNVTAVWQGNRDGESEIVVARLDESGPPATTRIPDRGQLPTAAASSKQVFITYIMKQDERRSVWLVRAKALA